MKARIVVRILTSLSAVTLPATAAAILLGPRAVGITAARDRVDSPPAEARLVPEVLSVSDATSAGPDWVLLDGVGRRIHVVGDGYVLQGSFGARGDGPGELRSPAALTLAGDTILVADRAVGRIDRFTKTGRFLRRTTFALEGCSAGAVRALDAFAGGAVLLATCIGPDGTAEARVYEVSASRPLPLTRAPIHEAEGWIDPLRLPLLAAGPDHFLLGFTGERCLDRYDSLGRPGPPVCRPRGRDRPLPDEEKLRLAALERRLPPGAGVRLRIPDRLPPFDRVFVTSRGVIYRVLTGVRTRALELGRPDGAVVRLPVRAGELTFVGSRSVLTAWQSVEGTRILIEPLPE